MGNVVILMTILAALLIQHLGTLLEASDSVIGSVGGPLPGLLFPGMLVRRVTARGVLVSWRWQAAILPSSRLLNSRLLNSPGDF